MNACKLASTVVTCSLESHFDKGVGNIDYYIESKQEVFPRIIINNKRNNNSVRQVAQPLHWLTTRTIGLESSYTYHNTVSELLRLPFTTMKKEARIASSTSEYGDTSVTRSGSSILTKNNLIYKNFAKINNHLGGITEPFQYHYHIGDTGTHEVTGSKKQGSARQLSIRCCLAGRCSSCLSSSSCSSIDAHTPLWRTRGDTSVAGGDSCTCYVSYCYSSALPSGHGFYSYYDGFIFMKPRLCSGLQQHRSYHKRDTSVAERSPGMKDKKWSQ